MEKIFLRPANIALRVCSAALFPFLQLTTSEGKGGPGRDTMQTIFKTLLQNAGAQRPKQLTNCATVNGVEVACIGPSRCSPCSTLPGIISDPVAEQLQKLSIVFEGL